MRELLLQSLGHSMELPIVEKPEESQPSHPRQIQPEGNFPSPIMAVDDHPVNLKILTTFLTSLGVDAFGASSGQDALQLFQEHPETRMVFMDIEMPLMNGFQTSARLREQGFEGVIVACSANSAPEMVQEYIQSGINDYLSKPFKKQQLSELLEKWNATIDDGPCGIWKGQQEKS